MASKGWKVSPDSATNLIDVYKRQDEYRPLDERAEKFLKQYTDKLIVIDTADYKLQGIDVYKRQVYLHI